MLAVARNDRGRRCPLADSACVGSFRSLAEVTFYGAAEFPSRMRLVLAWLQVGGPPGFFRMVITETDLRIEGRWLPLRALLPARRCRLSDLVSARLRGGLVILYFTDDQWWSMWSFKAEQILRELGSRGVPTTRDP